MFATKNAKTVSEVSELTIEVRDEAELVPLTVDQLSMIGGGEASVVTH